MSVIFTNVGAYLNCDKSGGVCFVYVFQCSLGKTHLTYSTQTDRQVTDCPPVVTGGVLTGEKETGYQPAAWRGAAGRKGLMAENNIPLDE